MPDDLAQRVVPEDPCSLTNPSCCAKPVPPALVVPATRSRPTTSSPPTNDITDRFAQVHFPNPEVIVTKLLAALPDQRAERDPQGPPLSNRVQQFDNVEFAHEVARIAGWLHTCGIGHGDVVAVMQPNCAELGSIMFATWRVGSALTPANPALTAAEVAHQLDDPGARMVIVDDRTVGTVTDLDIEVRTVDELAAVDETPSPDVRADHGSFALVIYASGTTGKPTGVFLDHANLIAITDLVLSWFEMSERDRCLLILSLFHIHGMMASIVSALVAGGSTFIAAAFDPSTYWQQVEQQRCTYCSTVPTIYARLVELSEDLAPDTGSLRHAICGAAPRPNTLIDRFEQRYGVPVIEGYGLSEGTVVSTVNPPRGKREPGTAGLPLPGQHVEIVDSSGDSLASGNGGDVAIGGPNVMCGYLGRPDATAHAVHGGRLFTGDVGRLDEDGYLTIVDRIKDMIIRRDENIYPKETDDVLCNHSAVAEAAVTEAADDILGQKPAAFAALRSGQDITGPRLGEHCRRSLGRYKASKAVYIDNELPKNHVGKSAKQELRDRVLREAS